MSYDFEPTPRAAADRLEQLDPRAYAHSRNHLDGAVSGLSPYLTHGFLSVPDVASVMYHRHRLGVQHRFIFELGWREYFQHMHQHLGNEGLAQSLSPGVLPDEAYSQELPQDVRAGCTGVPVVDNVDARPNADASRVAGLLEAQVLGAVRWRESVEAMVAAGVTTVIEVGPGKVLSGLIRRIDKRVRTLQVSDPESLDATVAALAKESDDV